MILSKQQTSEFETAARPLVKWLNENCNPHVTVIVTPARVVLTDGVCSIPIDDYTPA